MLCIYFYSNKQCQNCNIKESEAESFEVQLPQTLRQRLVVLFGLTFTVVYSNPLEVL